MADVRLSLLLDSTTSIDGDPPTGIASASAAYILGAHTLSASNDPQAGPTYSGDQIVRLYLNTPYQVNGYMGLRASTGATFTQRYGSADASALNTAHFFIDPLTPGDSIVSDSGHSFPTPQSVPEPASLAIFGVGAAALVGHFCWRRRRPGVRRASHPGTFRPTPN